MAADACAARVAADAPSDPPRWRLGPRVASATAILAVLVSHAPARSQPQDLFDRPAIVREEADDGVDSPDEAVEPGVLLPGDRGRERQLDRARRLVDEQRWSDAAATLDELLEGERDAFVAAGGGTTRRSIRSEAATLIEGLPRPGRDAYERLFAGRARKRLAEAIAADDMTAIVAVARRWLHTPAGAQAAIIAAVRALEAGQPLAAAAWLERLASSPMASDLEPTLTVMRAAARAAAGDAAAASLLAEARRRGRSSLRLGGRDAPLPRDAAEARGWLSDLSNRGGWSAADRDWRQFRGAAPRNLVTDASRPLLVPRYRVPLVRHPEEARRLEKRRRAAAGEGHPLLPAGTPVAAGDRIVVPTPLGILAVDFESGRRVWLESAVNAAEPEPDEEQGPTSVPRVFHDATSGNLASDGRLVFAVESRAGAVSLGRAGFGRLADAGIDREPGNSLTAYALANGEVRWRLGNTPERAIGGGSRWHLGPPLVVADELFILVDEGGEVHVEARAAADAAVRWSQPLATYDDGEAIDAGQAVARRLAGLTPALAEGVLVCPIGGGCVVAIDVANRSLLWAHAYPRPELGGFRLNADMTADDPRWTGEPAPVIAANRVVLAPFDGDAVVCLDLRDGRPLWRRPREGRITIAGVADDRLILVRNAGVEAIDMATGRLSWERSLGEGERPGGRGILTPRTLILPTDAPAVVEISVADGAVVGRSVARGEGMPGNLVAHRGEVISRGFDSLDVFHQQAALDERIETARRADPDSPWAAFWSGQAAIDSGDVEAGLDALALAAAAPGFRIPPDQVADAFVRAMRQDFPAAARRWPAFADVDHTGPAAEVDRIAVEEFLARGDVANAWRSVERLMATPRGSATPPRASLVDPSDPHLEISADRWLQSRLARIVTAAAEPLRTRIDEALGGLVAAALAENRADARRRGLELVCERLGLHPAAAEARAALAELAATTADPRATFRAELDALAATTGDAAAKRSARPPAGDDRAACDAAWPLGRVESRQLPHTAGADAGAPGRPWPLVTAGGPLTVAARAAFDLERDRLVFTDALGHPVGRPVAVAGLTVGFNPQFINQSAEVTLAALGRVAFVRSMSGLAAYDLGSDGSRPDVLWSKDDLETVADGAIARLGGRIARDAAVPLGMRIGEPDEQIGGGGRGLTPLPTGLVVPGRRSVAVLDPASGEVLWERREVPPGLEWFADDDFLCGCTVDGRGSQVLAAADGRLLHAFDVPHRRQRLASLGRRFVAIEPLDDRSPAIAARVRLDLVDPADREIRPLGTFDGHARATATGDGRLAVLEPSGRLTVLDLADGAVVFSRNLPAMPRRVERLHVQPWHDRYLVIAGSSEADDLEHADVSPLEPLLFGGGAAPLTGTVWAVARGDGRPLWPVPAAIERHCLHMAQPEQLPVLVFCRVLQHRGGQETLSVLCLDKRTGHAVFQHDRLGRGRPAGGGCELSGDPRAHSVTIRESGTGGGRLVLSFTGLPMAPRPPFQAGGRLPSGLDLSDDRLGDDRHRIPPDPGFPAEEPGGE